MTKLEYFSELMQGPSPRTRTEMTRGFWTGLVGLVESGLGTGLFAKDYPLHCDDGVAVIGCDRRAFGLALIGEFPELDWPFKPHTVPETTYVLDLVQFLFFHARDPQHGIHHGFPDHFHLLFPGAYSEELLDTVNRLFARNEMAYELATDGSVRFMAGPVVAEAFARPFAATGDAAFDKLMHRAEAKFVDRSAMTRREAVEPLWDAFERLKTLLDREKSHGSDALLNAASSGDEERAVLETEMRTLTQLGNTFHIRHHETSKIDLNDEMAAYFFLRMYALIRRLAPVVPAVRSGAS